MSSENRINNKLDFTPTFETQLMCNKSFSYINKNYQTQPKLGNILHIAAFSICKSEGKKVQ